MNATVTTRFRTGRVSGGGAILAKLGLRRAKAYGWPHHVHVTKAHAVVAAQLLFDHGLSGTWVEGQMDGGHCFVRVPDGMHERRQSVEVWSADGELLVARG